jgi:sugar phosphate isomerase/epimerase
MRVGYRVVSPEEVGKWGGDIVQISVYRGGKDNLARAGDCARACGERGMAYVLHPVGYSMCELALRDELLAMTAHAGEALILHDERYAGGRVEGEKADMLAETLEALRGRTPVSIENAADTSDALWFWERYADNITLDMGHMESQGINAVEFVRALPEDIIGKVRYVHMHRNAELRGGITDHWPLRRGCAELLGLAELLLRKRDVAVILELNEREETAESLALVRELAL